jgi:hypothetical protein
VAASLWSELRSHKFLAVRAVVTGWLTWFACITILFSLFAATQALLSAIAGSAYMWGARGLGDLNRALHIQETLHQVRMPWSLMVAIFISSLLMAYTSAGALIARLYRPHDRAMALAFVMSQVTLVAFNSGRTDNVFFGVAGVICTLFGAGFLSRSSDAMKLQ